MHDPPLGVSMKLTHSAERYCTAHGLRRRTPIYTANRFRRLCGEISAEQLTAEHVEQFRAACKAAGLRPATIENGVTDLRCIVKHATGRDLPPGRRMRLPRPVPNPVTLSDLSAVYNEAPAWVRKYLAVQFWTTARVSDCLSLLTASPADELRWTASKTGAAHVCPVPIWLKRHLAMPAALPVGLSSGWLLKQLRRALTTACESAGVARFTPQQIRQRGLTEWSQSNAMAAQVIHGSGLGVMGHYVDPLAVLQSAAGSVRLPLAFCTAEERAADDLPDIISRLDPDARSLLMETARRLA